MYTIGSSVIFSAGADGIHTAWKSKFWGGAGAALGGDASTGKGRWSKTIFVNFAV